jgi:hypothetical protein
VVAYSAVLALRLIVIIIIFVASEFKCSLDAATAGSRLPLSGSDSPLLASQQVAGALDALALAGAQSLLGCMHTILPIKPFTRSHRPNYLRLRNQIGFISVYRSLLAYSLARVYVCYHF